MVELPLLGSTIPTVMSLFFCCVGGKKGSTENVSQRKSSSTKEGLKEGAVLERAGNGLQADSNSVPVLEVPKDDLGDFSAVERQTEILKSYRKPAPPKNRARQSRVPRTQPSDSSIDIFSELAEESLKNDDSNENIESGNDGDILLRPHSDSNDKPMGDVGSSMLVDIDQTLANLQSSDQSTNVTSSESSSSEDKTDLPKLKVEAVQDEQLEMTVDDSKPENKSSTHGTLISSEVNAEVLLNVSASPKNVRPKSGPKVSPKPSPKVSPRARSWNNSSKSSLETPTDNREVNSWYLNPKSDNFEEETTDTVTVEETITTELQTLQKTTNETVTNTIQTSTHGDNTESEDQSIPAKVNIKEEIKSEPTNERSDSSEEQEILTTINTSESAVSSEGNDVDENNITEGSKSISANSISEAGDSESTSEESKTHVSSPTGISDVVVEAPVEQEETIQVVGEHGQSPNENGLQQTGTAKDDTSNGTTSKIPVRSGSKS